MNEDITSQINTHVASIAFPVAIVKVDHCVLNAALLYDRDTDKRRDKQ